MQPARSFALVVDEYDSSRPGYPDDAVRWLVGDVPLDVVDLGGCKADAFGRVHALQHVVYEAADSVVDPGDMFGHRMQPRIGVTKYVELGHL